MALDVAGMALIALGVPEGGWKVGAGLGLMLAGTWLVSSSLRGAAPGAAPDAEKVEAARGRWLPEPELRREPPRPVRLSAAAKAVGMAWLLMLVVGAGYAYLTVFSRNPGPPSQNLLDAEGETALATVHRREVREYGDGEPRYALYYNFKDRDGAAIRSSANVPKTLFERHQEGDQFEVVYLPGDPIAHYAPALTRPAFAERWLLMALVGLAALAFVLERRRRRHYKLVREGTPVAGVVENVRRRWGVRAYDVTFKLKRREGSLHASERNPMRRNGDIVTVLSDPMDAGDAVLYQQCLYRARE